MAVDTSNLAAVAQAVLDWLPTLAVAPSIAAVHDALGAALVACRGSRAYRFIWNDTKTINLPSDPALIPDAATLRALEAGQLAIHHDPQRERWALLPLLHVSLRGWIALPKPQEQDRLLLPLALLATARLVSFGSELDVATRERELSMLESDSAINPLETLRDAALDELYAAIERTLGARHMFMALYDEASGLLRFAVNVVNGQRSSSVMQWAAAEGLSGVVIRNNQTLVTNNYEQACRDFAVKPTYLEDAMRAHAWMGVPIRRAERVIGVLTIYADDPTTQYSAEYVRALEYFAVRAAMLLENARLYERTLQQTRQLELVNELGRTLTSTLDLEAVPSLIMGRVQQLLDVEEGSLLLLDHEANELVFSYSLSPYGSKLLGMRLPANVGLAGLVMSTGQSLVANRASKHPAFYQEIDEVTGHETRDLLVVPLLGRRGVIGVIELINHRDGTPFTMQDRTLLEAVADQAVIAIENAHLYTSTDRALAERIKQLDDRNKQLQDIVEAGNLIKASSDLALVLPQLAAAVSSTTGFGLVTIELVHREAGLPAQVRCVAASNGELRTEPIALDGLLALFELAQRRGAMTLFVPQGLSANNPLLRPAHAATEPPDPRVGAWLRDDMLVATLRAANGQLLGLITLAKPADGLQPTTERIQLLEIFANQLAVALENAYLYEQQRRNLQGVTALSALGMAINSHSYAQAAIWQLTVGGIVDSSGALGAGVYLLPEEDDEEPTILKVGRGHTPDTDLLGLALRTADRGRPLQLKADDPRFPASISAAGGRALLLLPLSGTDTTLGTLYVWYPRLLPPPEDQDLVALFANQAAVAVENKLLASAVQSGRDRLASILASTEEAIVLLDEELIIEEANSAFVRILGLDDATPLLDDDLVLWLERWAETMNISADDLRELLDGLGKVNRGTQDEARGQLACKGTRSRWYEWAVLPVAGARHAQRILVIHDITASIEIEHLRQDLTYMIIHDLRGPLSSVLTSLDLLTREMMGEVNEGQDKVLRIAMRSAQRLLNMINLLLEISQLEEGKLPLNPQPALLSEVIPPVIQGYDPMLSERKVAAQLRLPKRQLVAYIDPTTIDRVVQNLIDNAIKFSPAGSTIAVSAERSRPAALPGDHPPGDWITIAVRDAGPGIPPQERERIFEKFAQVQKSGVKGTGLGLTYCRLAVEAHGGRIWVADHDGPGSMIVFTVPATDLPPQPLPAPLE